jgi:putative radical SAM enzyme (TIGR03279 family)
LTYFTEIDWSAQQGGLVSSLEDSGLASLIGIQPGDELLAINSNQVNDVIDVSYYGAEEELEILVRRGADYLLFETDRDYGQSLGLEFEHPTFDTDIRRCNNLCEFCFVLQMSPGFRRTLYIKDDDYRYSFLFGHFVTLTNLSEHDWWRIETMGLSPLYVSVHVTDIEIRRRFLRNKKAPDILDQLAWLGEKGIEVHTQIVVVPEFNDGAILRNSISDLAELWPTVKSISVVPVGLTRFHKYGMRAHSPDEAQIILKMLEPLQAEFRERFGVNFVYATDEWYLVSGSPIPLSGSYDGQQLQENGLGMVRDFLEEWNSLREEITSNAENNNATVEKKNKHKFPSITLVTGMLFAETLSRIASDFGELAGIEVSVVGVVNKALGRSITVAGLLNAADIVEHLEKSGYGSLVILPYITFDHPQRISLDDVSPQQVADRLGVTVALAETMGDVWDAINGDSALVRSPLG